MKQQKRAFRIPGISQDAITLGCNRDHLSRALRGERIGSKTLLIRYYELQIEKLKKNMSRQNPKPATLRRQRRQAEREVQFRVATQSVRVGERTAAQTPSTKKTN